MPVFNRQGLVRDAVASALAQTYPEFELIIVDDGSTPPLERTALGEGAGDSRIRVVRQENAGSSAARNTAMKLATGTYYLFLDSDDLLTPDALRVLCEGSRGGEFDAVVGNWTNFTTTVETAPTRPSMPYRDTLANTIEGGWSTGSAIIRRGLEDEMSPIWMPWEVAEYYMKAMRRPASKVAHVDHHVVSMRQDSPDRLTDLYSHFDPIKAGLFWRTMKASFPLDNERRSAFDRHLFRFAFSAFHSGMRREAEEIMAAIDVDRLPHYHWYKFFSPAWFVRWAGVGVGLPLQAAVHDMRKRFLGKGSQDRD